MNRQVELIENGERVIQETRLWDEENGITRSMRSKEESMDYRYFPEPDLPKVYISEKRLSEVKNDMPEFSKDKIVRFLKEYMIPEYDAEILSSEIELADYYEKVVLISKDAKLSSNWMMTEVLRILKEKSISITDFNIAPENLGKLILLIKNNTISSKIAKDIFEVLLTENKDPELIVQEKGLVQITDNNEIEQIVDKVISENSQSVEDYKAGKDRAVGFLVGQAMKLSKGKANPKIVTDMILSKISS